jgi:hypothetical protein
MAIEIRKPVRRKTVGQYNVLYCSPRHARRVVVSIVPGDVLEFREQGRRMRWHLAIDTAFKYAVRCKVAADLAEKRKKRPERRLRRRR